MQPETIFPNEIDDQIAASDDVGLDDAEPKYEPMWPDDAQCTPAFTCNGMSDQFVGVAINLSFNGPGVAALQRAFDAAVDDRGQQRMLNVAKAFASTTAAKEASRTLAEVRRLQASAADARKDAETKRGEYTTAIAAGNSTLAAKLRKDIDDLARRADEDANLAAELRATAIEAQSAARRELQVKLNQTSQAIRTEAAERFNRGVRELGDLMANEIEALLIEQRLMMFGTVSPWGATAEAASDPLLQAAGLAEAV
jgi:hypothetical protein